MPPEQVKGEVERIGPTSDVYSLGVILFELLTGELPFQGSPMEVMAQILLNEAPLPSRLRPGLCPELDAVCGKAMAKAPENRYPSMKDFAAALTDVLRMLPATGQTVTAIAPAPGRNTGDLSAMATLPPEQPAILEPAAENRRRTLPVKMHSEFLLADEPKAGNRRHQRRAAGARRPSWLVVWLGLALLLAGAVVFSLFILDGRQDQGTNRAKNNAVTAKSSSSKKDKEFAKAAGRPEKEKGTVELPAAFTNDIGMKLVRIPAGKFTMGSPKDEKGRDPVDKGSEEQHEVEITKAFYLGVCEVTQKQFKTVMGYNPSYFSTNGKGKAGENYVTWPPAGGKDKVKDLASTDDLPVENVSREEARTFLKKLSERKEEKGNRRKYRLPTEAEWEYACRAGTSTPFNSGTSLATSEANVGAIGGEKGALGRTCKVGSYKPNAFGLFDMHGNVWEWCEDWYDKDYYAKSPPKDPPGPGEGLYQVLRGGGWDSPGWSCRSAVRFRITPGGRYISMGFRAALVLSQE
jgi:formylglycine-generating enzyme required for sulfatase activity